jgi:hypothetical protein
VTEEEAEAFARSIRIDEVRFGRRLARPEAGQVLCWRSVAGTWNFAAARRAGLPDWARAEFDEWARQRAYLLALTLDPDVDGWLPREEDAAGWQLTYVPGQGPADPFAAAPHWSQQRPA